MTGRSVFDANEWRAVAAGKEVGSFEGITKDELTGLLAALGEYTSRAILQDDHSHLPPSHQLLLKFQPSGQGQHVYDHHEREELSRHKYISGYHNITKDELLDLLAALGEYTKEAAPIRLPPGIWYPEGVVRVVNAHNALLRFSIERFTLEEFGRTVKQVVAENAARHNGL